MTAKQFIKKAAILLCLLGLVLPGGTGCDKYRKSRRASAAEKFFKAGAYDSAEIQYRGVLQLDRNDANAWAKLGEIYRLQGRLGAAAYFLREAATHDPKNVDVKVMLGKTFLDLGAREQAHAVAKELVALSPQSEEAIVLFVDSAATNGIAESKKLLESLPPTLKNGASALTASAIVAAREGRMGDAEKLLTSALAQKADYVPALQALYQVSLYKRDFTNAMTFLKRASESSPLRSPMRVLYATLLKRLNRADESKAVLQQVYAGAPDFTPATLALAEIDKDEGKLKESDAKVRDVLSRDPENWSARMLAGEIMLAGRDTNAVAYFKRIAEDWQKFVDERPAATNRISNTNAAETAKAPNVQNKAPASKSALPRLSQRLGEAYLLAGDADRALVHLNNAVVEDTNAVDVALMRAQLLLRKTSPEPAAAAASLDKIVAANPNLPIARLMLAQAQVMLRKPALAIEQYSYLSGKYPTNAEYPILLGTAQAELTNYVAARRSFEDALVRSPTNLGAFERIVRLDLAERKSGDALNRVQNRIAKAPTIAPLYYLESLVYAFQAAEVAPPRSSGTNTVSPAAKEKIQLAIGSLSKAVEANPDFVVAYLSLYDAQLALGKTNEAFQTLKSCLVRTNEPDVLLKLALLQEATGSPEEAKESYEKLVKVAPRSIVVLNNLASLICKLPGGDYPRAIELARRAKEIAPRLPEISDTLGWAYHLSGDYDNALPLLEDVASKLNQPEVQFHLGLTYYMLGNEAAAKPILQKALQLDPKFPGVEQAKVCLDILNLDPATADKTVIDALRKRLESNRKDPPALKRLAMIEERSGAYKNAAALYLEYSEAVRSNTAKSEALIRLAAIAFERLNDPARALEAARSARSLDPLNSAAGKVLGQLSVRAGDFKRGATLLEEAARTEQSPTLSPDLAMAYYGMGRIAEATNQMAQVAKSPEHASEASTFIKLTTATQGASAAALATEAQQMLASKTNYLPALMVLAAAMEQRNQPQEAAQAYNRILTISPSFIPAAKSLVLLNVRSPGSDTAAYNLLVKERETVTQDPQLAAAMGILAFRKGDFQSAVRLLQSPTTASSPEGVFSLQAARQKLGQKVDQVALRSAIQAGLPKELEEDAKKLLGDKAAASK